LAGLYKPNNDNPSALSVEVASTEVSARAATHNVSDSGFFVGPEPIVLKNKIADSLSSRKFN
jgi:hypothetical protein